MAARRLNEENTRDEGGGEGRATRENGKSDAGDLSRAFVPRASERAGGRANGERKEITAD